MKNRTFILFIKQLANPLVDPKTVVVYLRGYRIILRFNLLIARIFFQLNFILCKKLGVWAQLVEGACRTDRPLVQSEEIVYNLP